VAAGGRRKKLRGEESSCCAKPRRIYRRALEGKRRAEAGTCRASQRSGRPRPSLPGGLEHLGRKIAKIGGRARIQLQTDTHALSLMNSGGGTKRGPKGSELNLRPMIAPRCLRIARVRSYQKKKYLSPTNQRDQTRESAIRQEALRELFGEKARERIGPLGKGDNGLRDPHPLLPGELLKERSKSSLMIAIREEEGKVKTQGDLLLWRGLERSLRSISKDQDCSIDEKKETKSSEGHRRALSGEGKSTESLYVSRPGRSIREMGSSDESTH